MMETPLAGRPIGTALAVERTWMWERVDLHRLAPEKRAREAAVSTAGRKWSRRNPEGLIAFPVREENSEWLVLLEVDRYRKMASPEEALNHIMGRTTPTLGYDTATEVTVRLPGQEPLRAVSHHPDPTAPPPCPWDCGTRVAVEHLDRHFDMRHGGRSP